MEFTSFINKYRSNLKGRIYPIKLDDFIVPDFYQVIHYRQVSSDNIDNDINIIIPQLKEMASTNLDKPHYRAEEITKDRMDAILRKEWETICRRLNDAYPTSDSMTHIYLFGWAVCSGINSSNANPLISCYQIKIKINDFLHALLNNDRESVIKLSCTIRYLCFCALIASGNIDYPDKILLSLIDGLHDNNDRRHHHIHNMKNAIERLIKNNDNSSIVIDCVGDIIRSVGAIGHIIGVTLEDIYKEELSSNRKGNRKARSIKIAVDNTVTHEITIYFDDKRGMYFNIMDVIRKYVPFNIMQSMSETMIPDKLAYAKLRICYSANDLDLITRIWEAIRGDSDVWRHVLDVSISDINISMR